MVSSSLRPPRAPAPPAPPPRPPPRCPPNPRRRAGGPQGAFVGPSVDLFMINYPPLPTLHYPTTRIHTHEVIKIRSYSQIGPNGGSPQHKFTTFTVWVACATRMCSFRLSRAFSAAGYKPHQTTCEGVITVLWTAMIGVTEMPHRLVLLGDLGRCMVSDGSARGHLASAKSCDHEAASLTKPCHCLSPR